MMAACNLSVSGKVPIEHFAILNVRNVEQTPSGNGRTALPSNLPAEQSDNPLLNSVIMRFDNSLFAL